MDTRALTGRRPTGQRAQQIVSGYVSLNQPAPSAFTDTLYVVIPSHQAQAAIAFAGGAWPQCQGATLPTAGTAVTVGYDERRVPIVLTWGGNYFD